MISGLGTPPVHFPSRHVPTTSVPQSLNARVYHDYVSVTAVASLMRGLLVASRLNIVRMNPVSLGRHYGEEQEDAKREDWRCAQVG